MSKLKTLKKIGDYAVSFFTKNPKARAAVGVRLGNKNITATGIRDRILAHTSQNKLQTALIGMELASVGGWFLEWMDAEEQPEIQESLEAQLDNVLKGDLSTTLPQAMSRVTDPDPTSAVSITSLKNYVDEMRLIQDVVNIDGGMDNLAKRRAAYNLSDEMYTLFGELKAMGVR